ncbi:MAG TPA: hypothetical protein VK348_06725, partial [Planctomycetota bacterium]|nr:hypothetical protein [Planctomycetota bacterium]
GLVTWRQQGLRAALAPRMLAFGAIALVPCVLFFWHAARLHTQYGNTFGVISGGDSKWGGPTWWFDPHFYAELARIDLWQTFGVGGSVLAVLGLWLWRCDSFRAVVLIWFGVIFVYYLIIARYASNETSATHYHIFTAVPAALAVGAGAAGLNDLCRQHGWSVQGVALVVLLPVMLIVQQVRRDWLVGLLEELPVFRAAGVELARLSAPEDLAIVTSTSSRISRGVTDNFEDPRVLYYAWRHGRMLPADELRAEELHRLLGIGARWVVVFDEVLPQAQPDFLAALADLEVAARGADFTIYRVRA